MVFYTNPIPCIILVLIFGLHALSVLFRGKLVPVFVSVNICLHGLLAAAELYLGSSLGEITLLYAISLLVYLLLSVFFVLKRDCTDQEGGNENDL